MTCSETGCSKEVWCRGYCGSHYARHKRNGTLKVNSKFRECQVEDCIRPVEAKRYCYIHYRAFLKWGPALKKVYSMCECGRNLAKYRIDGKTLCKACHALHWYYNLKPLPEGQTRGTNRKEFVGYNGAHSRIRSQRGHPKNYPCVDCDNPAEEWSLSQDAETIISESGSRIGSPYSMNPFDYEPRCKACHIAYDTQWRAGRGYGIALV